MTAPTPTRAHATPPALPCAHAQPSDEDQPCRPPRDKRGPSLAWRRTTNGDRESRLSSVRSRDSPPPQPLDRQRSTVRRGPSVMVVSDAPDTRPARTHAAPNRRAPNRSTRPRDSPAPPRERCTRQRQALPHLHVNATSTRPTRARTDTRCATRLAPANAREKPGDTNSTTAPHATTGTPTTRKRTEPEPRRSSDEHLRGNTREPPATRRTGIQQGRDGEAENRDTRGLCRARERRSASLTTARRANNATARRTTQPVPAVERSRNPGGTGEKTRGPCRWAPARREPIGRAHPARPCPMAGFGPVAAGRRAWSRWRTAHLHPRTRVRWCRADALVTAPSSGGTARRPRWVASARAIRWAPVAGAPTLSAAPRNALRPVAGGGRLTSAGVREVRWLPRAATKRAATAPRVRARAACQRRARRAGALAHGTRRAYPQATRRGT